MAPRTSYPLPAQHLFTGLDAWRVLSLRAAADPAAPFLTWHPIEGEGRTWSYGAFARDALAVTAGLPPVRTWQYPVSVRQEASASRSGPRGNGARRGR